MTNKNLPEALKKLASGNEFRSNTARLRDVFHEVEAAISAGVSRQKIVETLADAGLKMSLKTFEGTLYRIRKKSSKRDLPATARSPEQKTEASQTSQEQQDETDDEPIIKGSTDPSSLNKIMQSKPDLAALARARRERKKK